MGLQYFGSKISENISIREPEGYLYCLNVPIARTGVQKYLAHEVGLDGDGVVDVHRTPEEVFKPAAIASFEAMPVTRDHPPEAVDVTNIGAYQRGHVQNVRRGKGEFQDCLMADLVITHKALIDDILNNGVRDVSCGYELEYVKGKDGKVYQQKITGNHVAVVDNGRAGDRVTIRDSAPESITGGAKEKTKSRERGVQTVDKKGSVFARMFASFARDEGVLPEEVIEAADEIFSGKEINQEGKEDKNKQMDKRARDEFPVKPEMEKEEEKKPVPAFGSDEDELLKLVYELAQEVKSLKEMVLTQKAPAAPSGDEEPEEPKEELDPLVELEKEVSSKEPMNEGSVTVPPEDIEVEDEEMEEEPEFLEEEEEQDEEETAPSEQTKEAVVAAINELKPIIAGLPAADRRRVADAASKAIRRAVGMTPVADAKSRANLAYASRRKKSANDRQTIVDAGRKLGEKIMRERNPHYRSK